MRLNSVYLAENLEFLKHLDSEIIDLIYIDPPFFSGVDYKEFSDLWDSLDAYLDFMMVRIREMYRVLKKSGSFYCHCDPNAAFEIKILCDKHQFSLERVEPILEKFSSIEQMMKQKTLF